MPQEDNTLVVAENVTFNFVEYSVDLATTESAGKTLITL
jgi:L-ribulose-5-phosphate 3-epimerase UlaE